MWYPSTPWVPGVLATFSTTPVGFDAEGLFIDGDRHSRLDERCCVEGEGRVDGQLIIRHRHHGSRCRVADTGRDLLDADGQRRDEDDLVDRHLHAEPALGKVQISGDSVDSISRQLGIKLRDLLRVKRGLHDFFTFQAS